MTPYQHPDWAALLAGVVAAADDDLPRLAAADWLDERGDAARAEFIRVQCLLASGDDRPELKWREQVLGANPLLGGQWAVEACPGLVRLDFEECGSPLRAVAVCGAERVTFRRGFPWRVVCPAADWRWHGSRTVPRQPVEELSLTRCDTVPLADWWDVLDTLGQVKAVTLDRATPTLGDWLRDRLPGVRIVCRSPAPPNSPPPAPKQEGRPRSPSAQELREQQEREDELERRRRPDPIPW